MYGHHDGHRNDMNKESQQQSVVSKQRSMGHEFNWDKIKILDKKPKYYKRLIVEMIHIFTSNITLTK